MIQDLDATDLKILKLLQQNCEVTIKELASMINLSPTPTFERKKRLERMGFIRGYMAVLNAEQLERGFVVYCNVTMRQINQQIASQFTQSVQAWDEVTECYNVSGDFDYLMKICCSSMNQYQEFILKKIGAFPYVSHIQSIFVMGTLKFSYGFSI